MDDGRARRLFEDYDVVLCPSAAQANALSKQVAASCVGGVFGTEATSFSAWLRETWALAGDGRAIADSMVKALVMDAVMRRMELRHLRVGSGLAAAAVRLVERGAGLAAFDCALACVAGVADDELAHVAPGTLLLEPGQRKSALPAEVGMAERELLILCVEYLRALAAPDTGLVERGHAMALLAADADTAFPRPLSVCVVGDAPLPPVQREFWQHLEGRVSCTQVKSDGTPWPQDGPELAALLSPELVRPPADVGVRFAFPAGRYAQAPLVADVVTELHAELGEGTQESERAGEAAPAHECAQESARPRILVASADPLSLYEQLVPALVVRGISCAAAGRRAFGASALGRAYIELYECIATAADGAPDWDRRRLADVVYNPVLGIGHLQASRIYARMRADRLLSFTACLDELSQEFPRVSALRALVQDPTPDAFARFSAQLAELPGADEMFLSEQCSALDLVRRACAAAAPFAPPGENSRPLLSASTLKLMAEAVLDLRCATDPPGRVPAPDVMVVSLADAASRQAGACAALVVCDLDSEHYSAASRDDAVALLLDKLGVPRGEGTLERQRRMWRALVAVPTRHLVLSRVLNDVDGEPTYPCPMLEEFTDLYRDDTRTTDDLHKVFAIPPVLQRGVNVSAHATPLFSRGEDGFTDNVAFGLDSPATADAPGERLEGEALERMLRKLRRPPRSEWPDGVEPAVPHDAPLRLSPSQIEAYLECPYKWFAARWMGVGVPDEDFGPLERGSFAHEALRLFFERFGRKPRADEADMEQAFACMADVCRELLLAQEDKPCGSRLAPLPNSPIEQGEVAELCKHLQLSVAHEPSFLIGTGFTPKLFEFSFADYDVELAGCRLTGVIDRVDIDEAGNAVVVDYKGSLSAAYDLPKIKEYADRGFGGKKVQALLYMAAIAGSPKLREAMSEAAGTHVRRVVGALYLSYRCTPRDAHVRGVLAREEGETGLVLPTASSLMPRYALSPDDDEEPGLPQVLADLENMVRTQVVARIEAGRVPREPRDSGTCKYCPVAACEGRIS